MLVELVKDTITKYSMLQHGEKVLIGVSGGHDSIVLLHVLREISKTENYQLHVAHLNHGVRGKDSDEDESYVCSLAKSYGYPFYSKKVDMESYAREKRLSAEEAGRELRYSFFREIIEKEMKRGKIAVAHNKNDQVETVIMRIIRGTGLDGLKGIEFVNNDIIRPLLKAKRSEIESYCEKNNLQPKIDKTNFENIYSRNKVRLELIPYIENNFNPNLIDTIERFSNTVRKDSDYISKVSLASYEDLVIKREDSTVVIDNEKLVEEEDAIRYRVIRLAILEVLGSLEGIEQKHLDCISELSFNSKTGKSIDLIRGLTAKITYDKLSIEKSEKKGKIRYNYKVEYNEDLFIPEIHTKLLSRVLDIEEVDILDSGKFKKYFDLDKIQDGVYIRSRLPGDKVKLLGMKGRKKLKDYYIDAKIPQDMRETIPLVEIDGEIAWIVGCRLGEKAKVMTATKRVLMLEFFTDKNYYQEDC